MKKVIKNGKVAVLVSHGFGCGWYSANTDHQELLFHPKLVKMVKQNRTNEINENWVKENLGIENVYCSSSGYGWFNNLLATYWYSFCD